MNRNPIPTEQLKPTGEYLTDMVRARNAEWYGMWEEALTIRKIYQQKEDIDAINLILEATRKGDEFRRLTEGVHEAWERRDINNAELHQKLTEAHNRVYKNI